MQESKSKSKDPICGMTVDEATAISAERDGETFYFCSDHCQQKFLSAPDNAKPDDKSGGCCAVGKASAAGILNEINAALIRAHE